MVLEEMGWIGGWVKLSVWDVFFQGFMTMVVTMYFVVTAWRKGNFSKCNVGLAWGYALRALRITSFPRLVRERILLRD